MKVVRKAIFPRKDHQLMEVDYSGIEVGIGCAYHNDPRMIKYVSDPSTDMHGDMAAQIFKIDNFNPDNKLHYKFRQTAKNGM